MTETAQEADTLTYEYVANSAKTEVHIVERYRQAGLPLIASLSLGGERRFDMRLRAHHGRVVRMVLEHGSLLVMGGAMPQYWQHSLARTAQPVGERINLTFRLTLPRGQW